MELAASRAKCEGKKALSPMWESKPDTNVSVPNAHIQAFVPATGDREHEALILCFQRPQHAGPMLGMV